MSRHQNSPSSMCIDTTAVPHLPVGILRNANKVTGNCCENDDYSHSLCSSDAGTLDSLSSTTSNSMDDPVFSSRGRRRHRRKSAANAMAGLLFHLPGSKRRRSQKVEARRRVSFSQVEIKEGDRVEVVKINKYERKRRQERNELELLLKIESGELQYCF